MMRKRRKCFALFARKQRKKIHLQVVDTSTVTKHAANTDYVRVRGSKHYNRVIVWETCLGIWNKTGFFIVTLDSKYFKMTPKFVKKKSHWLHSWKKIANSVCQCDPQRLNLEWWHVMSRKKIYVQWETIILTVLIKTSSSHAGRTNVNKWKVSILVRKLKWENSFFSVGNETMAINNSSQSLETSFCCATLLTATLRRNFRK